MFTRVFSVLALALCASASVFPRTNGCSTGSLQCCDSVESASDPAVIKELGLLNVALSSVTGQVGLTCDPLTVVGTGTNSCNAQSVCCTGNNYNGGVAVLDCTPINLTA